MAKTTAVTCSKGGVGKTCVSYNLAEALAEARRKTLLIDFNTNQNLTETYIESPQYPTVSDILEDKDIDPKRAIIKLNAYLDFIPADNKLYSTQDVIVGKRFRELLLINQIDKVKNLYEHILIDTQDNLQGLTTLAIAAADQLLIPLRYEEDSLVGISKVFDAIAEIKAGKDYSYKLLRNGRNESYKTMINRVESELHPLAGKGILLDTIIPQDQNFANAKSAHQSILQYAPKSKGAEAIRQLRKELFS